MKTRFMQGEDRIWEIRTLIDEKLSRCFSKWEKVNKEMQGESISEGKKWSKKKKKEYTSIKEESCSYVLGTLGITKKPKVP